MPYLGTRRRLTIRVPVDVYARATVAAARRGWTMTGFCAFAVAEQVKREGLAARPQSRRREERKAAGTVEVVELADGTSFEVVGDG